MDTSLSRWTTPRALAAALCAAIVCTVACTTVRTSEPAGASQASAVRTEPVRAWRLVENGERRGSVVQFQDPNARNAPGHEFYSVRNVLAQELGSIDAQGRAWRFVPHQREAQWLGTGTVVEGARRILGAGASSSLVEITLDELRRDAAPSTPPPRN